MITTAVQVGNTAIAEAQPTTNPLGGQAALPATYQDYLQSFEWQIKRQQVIDIWGGRCALCNSGGSLEVHHRTYERLGNERLTDLLPLCDDCHKKVSGKLPKWYDWLGRVDKSIFEGIRW